GCKLTYETCIRQTGLPVRFLWCSKRHFFDDYGATEKTSFTSCTSLRAKVTLGPSVIVVTGIWAAPLTFSSTPKDSSTVISLLGWPPTFLSTCSATSR